MPSTDDRERYRQRARKQRSPRSENAPKVSAEIEEAYDLIPEIGNGYRWYDWPYRALWWMSTSWLRKFTPPPIRYLLNRGINWLLPFNQHDRDYVQSLDGWMHNIRAPREEHVASPRFWLVEFFPPSDLPRLEVSLKRNGWNVPNLFSATGERNQVVLEQSRAGNGALWWNLINVVRHDANWASMGAVREHLPDEFEFVEMKAVQVGQSLTAVVTEFHVSDKASQSLDDEWHRQHEPLLLWGWPRPRSLDRHWATIRDVQEARRDMHYIARDWLARKLPGFFARTGEPHPLLDLMLFENIDPTILRRPTQTRDEQIAEADALRALGLERPVFRMLTSPSLPKLVLHPLRRVGEDPLGDDPTWTLWGSRAKVMNAVGRENFRGYVGDDNHKIASMLVDEMSNLFVMIGVSSLLGVTEARFAQMRDRAGAQHGKFRPKAVRSLRRNFLTLSLDLASIHADVTAFWNRSWRWDGDAKFSWVLSPDERSRVRGANRKPDQPTSFNESLKEQQATWFLRLLQADKDYREILSTVASLGSSVNAFRTGRLALWVAAASLAVAVATVLVSNVGGKSVFQWISSVIQGWL